MPHYLPVRRAPFHTAQCVGHLDYYSYSRSPVHMGDFVNVEASIKGGYTVKKHSARSLRA